MKVIVTKITDINLLRKACESTMQAGSVSNISLDTAYCCEHSPMRTQIFWLEMEDIPTFVSVHQVRHKIGVEHFVRSNREDRGGNAKADRDTPVLHSCLLNAESLVSMAKMRLCYQASKETRKVMQLIKESVKVVDPDLAKYMQPKCVYRNGMCNEPRSCGVYDVASYEPEKIMKRIRKTK